jgi:hypothetical protein
MAVCLIGATVMPPASARAVTMIEVIDFANASVVQVRGINDSGQLVGYRVVSGVNESFVRDGSTLSFFQVNASSTSALAINDAGTTVGGVSVPGGSDGFVRTLSATTITFQPLGNTDSAAIGINNAGDVVASGNAFGSGGFLRKSSGTTSALAYPASANETILKTNATDITNTGRVIGHAIGQGELGFFGRGWYSDDDGASFVTLQAPGALLTYAWGADDSRLIVGDFSTGLGAPRSGFIYDTDTQLYTVFNVAGADWTVPTGINNDGNVVGFSRDATSGRVSGFVAVVPEPATLSLLAGAALLGLRRRQK